MAALEPTTSRHLFVRFTDPTILEISMLESETPDVTSSIFSVTIAIVTALIAFSGIITNPCIAWTFIKLGLDEGINICYVGLAIVDFLFDLSMVIFCSAFYCGYIDKTGAIAAFKHFDPDVIHYFMGSIGDAFFMMSTLIIGYIAIAKSICVLQPFRFKQIFTSRMFLINVAIFSVVTLILNLPILTLMGSEYKFDYRTNTTRVQDWAHPSRKVVKKNVRFITFFLLTLTTEIVIVTSVIIMTMQIHKSMRLRDNRRPQRVSQQRASQQRTSQQRTSQQRTSQQRTSQQGRQTGNTVRLTKMESAILRQVVTLSLIYLICNFARMIHSMWLFSDPEFDYEKSKENLYILMTNVAYFFASINCSMNIYVYLIYNSRFRAYWCGRSRFSLAFISKSTDRNSSS